MADRREREQIPFETLTPEQKTAYQSLHGACDAKFEEHKDAIIPGFFEYTEALLLRRSTLDQERMSIERVMLEQTHRKSDVIKDLLISRQRRNPEFELGFVQYSFEEDGKVIKTVHIQSPYTSGDPFIEIDRSVLTPEEAGMVEKDVREAILG